MIPVMCLVQEGQISAQAEYSLRTELIRFVLRKFGAAPDIDWIVVPKGSGFTAAEPSRSLIASVHSNRVLSQVDRVAMLKELGKICMTCTDRSWQEILTSIKDPS